MTACAITRFARNGGSEKAESRDLGAVAIRRK